MQIEIIAPDDWHCHLRDGAYLNTTVPAAAKQFKRVIVMPNLVPPITTVEAAEQYRRRILAAMPADCSFTPLMTLYLTKETSAQEIRQAKTSGFIYGGKLYPQGATTNSQAGITNIEQLYPIVEIMSEEQLPLLIHGEVTDPNTDIFDREKLFIERHLAPLINTFPDLKIVFEHITTTEAVDFVKSAQARVAATITPHHLFFNRNDMFTGGIRPHHYCLPILKRRNHQEALVQAAISGDPKFFIGTDSAPHSIHKKEVSCGCAGIYHDKHALEIYAQIFETHGALNKLEDFTSRFGPAFYGLPLNKEKIILKQVQSQIPASLPFGDEAIIPFLAGQRLRFKQVEATHG